MAYPYDNDDEYYYGLTESQIRARMNYAMNGDESEYDPEFDISDTDDSNAYDDSDFESLDDSIVDPNDDWPDDDDE